MKPFTIAALYEARREFCIKYKSQPSRAVIGCATRDFLIFNHPRGHEYFMLPTGLHGRLCGMDFYIVSDEDMKPGAFQISDDHGHTELLTFELSS